MDPAALRWRVPCAIDDGPDGLSQLEHRLQTGFYPNVALKGAIKDNLPALSHLIDSYGRRVSFNMQTHSGREKEKYMQVLDFVAALRENHGELIGEAVGIKAAEKFIEGPYNLRSTVGAEAYAAGVERNHTVFYELAHYADHLDLRLELENRPHPNYVKAADRPGTPADPAARWSGSWVPALQTDGTLTASSKEIIAFLRSVQNGVLQLDLEHLAQTCQYGFIFNLERASSGVLRLGDLDEPAKALLRSQYPELEGDVLLDYRGMSRAESKHLERYGYTVREGQPLVYEKRLTLLDEALTLADTLSITAVTPGFQPYAIIEDERDGRPVRIIGSHLPGIHPQYIHNPHVRAALESKANSLHWLAQTVMVRNGVLDIELEPQLDDGSKPVYEGRVWEEQMAYAQRQLLENFATSTFQDTGPEYF